MASRFGKMVLGVFFDTDKLAATNANYKARIAAINEKDAKVKAAIANAKAQNKAAFTETIRTENLKLKRAWSK